MAKNKVEEEVKEMEEEVKKEEKKEEKDGKSKSLIVFKALYVFFKGVLDVILNNRFVQIVFFMFFFYYFGRSLFRENKVGIFINGTDNFYNYNYGEDVIKNFRRK